MTTRKRALGVALCLVVTAGVLVPAGSAGGQKGKSTLQVGANERTYSHIYHSLGFAPEHYLGVSIRVAKLSDAAVYRQLMAGKLSLGSVVYLPEDVGVKGFDKAFKKAPTTYVGGYVAVLVLVPRGRAISGLTLSQLRDMVSGKITTWAQLGAGKGKLRPAGEPIAWRMAATLTGVKLANRFETGKYHVGATASSVGDNARRREEALRGIKPSHSKVTVEEAAKNFDDFFGLTMSPYYFHEPRRKDMRLVGVVPRGGEQAVLPTRETIGKGQYALGRAWRILIHPSAGKMAHGCARRCLQYFDDGRDTHANARVAGWLIKMASSGGIKVVRLIMQKPPDFLKDVARAYEAAHADTAVTFAQTRDEYLRKTYPDAFLEQAGTAFVYPGRISVVTRKEQMVLLKKLYGGDPPEKPIAHQALLVLVHPKSPVSSVTYKQLQQIGYRSPQWWSIMGGPANDRIRVYRQDKFVTCIALTQGPESMPEPFWRRSGIRTIGLLTLGMVIAEEGLLLKKIADTEGVLGLVMHSKRSGASGLKILKVAPPSGGPAVLPTPANVGTGKYFARLPYNILIHPKAGKATRDFVAWLASPEAGRVMARYHVYNATGQGAGGISASSGGDAPAFMGKVSGAAAVLPIETLQTFFVMADARHHAIYEQAITEGIENDKRLKLVHRNELKRVMAERTMLLLGLGGESSKPIVAADVFVLPHMATEGHRSFLRVEAIHVPTASLLGELKVAIDPLDPAKFPRPLAQQVGAWWPGVLGRLVSARKNPVWSLVDIHTGNTDRYELADTITSSLRKSLRQNAKLFLTDYAVVTPAQQEVLMNLSGLSRRGTGRFTPAADFLLEGTLLADDRLQLRILSGKNLRVIAKQTIQDKDPDRLARAAVSWVTAQGEKKLTTPVGAGGTKDDWAARQATLEYKKFLALKKQIEVFGPGAKIRATLAGRAEILQEDQEKVARMKRRRLRHIRAAAQLDPSNDIIAYEAATEEGSSVANRWAFAHTLRRAELSERFAETFPKSRHHRSMTARAIGGYRAVRRIMRLRTIEIMGRFRYEIPPGIDRGKLAVLYTQKVLGLYDDYARKYLPAHKTREPGDMSFPVMMSRYLRWQAQWLVESEATDATIERVVEDWSKLFDKHGEAAAHSDFLKLHIIAWRNDKPGFLKMLRAMQKQRPDPKDVYWQGATWQGGAKSVARELSRLFGIRTVNGTTFSLWVQGKRGPGDLPCAGYDPSKDRHTPTARKWD